jgi:branched-chain amino acid transport system substrate-binding protein
VAKKLGFKSPGGRPFELVLHDDKSNPTEAARAVTQVINNDKVVVVVGPSTGSGILAAGPIASRLKVPLIAPAGTMAVGDRKNEFWPWVFRMAINDATSIEFILKDMAKGKAKKVGVLFQEDAYGKTGVDLAKEIAPKLGLEVVETASAPYTATDLTAHATRLRNAGVDTVFLQVSIAALGTSFLKAARQIGLDKPIYANAGLAQRSFAENVGPEADGLRTLSIGNLPFEPIAEEKELSDLLRADGKVPQGWGEIVGANGLLAALAAIDAQAGKEITGESMRTALEGLCGFRSYARGKICYSPDNHDGWDGSSLTIVEIRDKKMRTPD